MYEQKVDVLDMQIFSQTINVANKLMLFAPQHSPGPTRRGMIDDQTKILSHLKKFCLFIFSSFFHVVHSWFRTKLDDTCFKNTCDLTIQYK